MAVVSPNIVATDSRSHFACWYHSYSFSSVQSLDRLGRREDMRDDSAEILFQSFLREALVSSFSVGRDVPSLMLSIQHFRSRPRRRPPSQGVLRNGLGEAVVACDMPEPCEFPSLDSCQKRFLWAHKEVDLAPRPVVVKSQEKKVIYCSRHK